MAMCCHMFTSILTTPLYIVSSFFLKVGDSLPSVVVHELTPTKDFDNVNIGDVFKGKKGVLFGVPGAFTPTCHQVGGRGQLYIDENVFM